MSLPVTVPFTFGNATTTQSLSSLDTNFTTIKNAVNGLTNGASQINVASISATGTANSTTFLRGDGAWATVSGGGGSGTVTSINANSTIGFTFTGGPVTSSGTLTLSGPTPGTSGNVLTSNGTAWVSQAASGGGVASDRQVFNASGTWTKPASGTYAVIQIWGCGGGAGQSGNGIGAGGGGGYSSTTCLLSDLASTVSVTIGAGGAGATGTAAGGTGGSITFGSYLTHVGGIGGFRYTIGCNTTMVDGASGRLSASSGLTLIAGSVELSGTYSYQTSSSVYPKNQYYAPCQGGSSQSQVGTSVFGGNGGAVGGATGGAGSAPGGGGGQGTTTGGAGAVGRVIVTVY